MARLEFLPALEQLRPALALEAPNSMLLRIRLRLRPMDHRRWNLYDKLTEELVEEAWRTWSMWGAALTSTSLPGRRWKRARPAGRRG